MQSPEHPGIDIVSIAGYNRSMEGSRFFRNKNHGRTAFVHSQRGRKMAFSKKPMAIRLKRSRIRELYAVLKSVAMEVQVSSDLGYCLGKTGLRLRDEMDLIKQEEQRLFKKYDTDKLGRLKENSDDAGKFNVEFNDFLSEEIDVEIFPLTEAQLDDSKLPVSLYMELGVLVMKPPSEAKKE